MASPTKFLNAIRSTTTVETKNSSIKLNNDVSAKILSTYKESDFDANNVTQLQVIDMQQAFHTNEFPKLRSITSDNVNVWDLNAPVESLKLTPLPPNKKLSGVFPFPNVRNMYLRNMDLTEVDFSELHQLTQLIMYNCTVSESILRPSLKELHLTCTNIKVDEAVLPNIEKLYFFKSETVVDTLLSSKLEFLFLHDYKFEIPNLSHLENLKTLAIVEPHVQYYDIFPLSLEMLYVKSHIYFDIDQIEIKKLPKLTHLDISCDKLKKLPENVFNTNVVYLNLAYNIQLEVSVEELKKFTSLETLTMIYTKTLPDKTHGESEISKAYKTEDKIRFRNLDSLIAY